MWGDDYWMMLRDASRYATLLERITLPDPPTAMGVIKGELATLLEYQKSPERETRRPEILEEADGPPPYYERVLMLDDPGNANTRALLYRVVTWSRPFILHFKAHYQRARPAQLEPRLYPMVDFPRHASYPSGHSTQSHLIALIVGPVTRRKDITEALWAKADRIAQNCEYAGIHYPSDSAAGVKLAEQLVPVFLNDDENGPTIAEAKRDWH